MMTGLFRKFVLFGAAVILLCIVAFILVKFFFQGPPYRKIVTSGGPVLSIVLHEGLIANVRAMGFVDLHSVDTFEPLWHSSTSAVYKELVPIAGDDAFILLGESVGMLRRIGDDWLLEEELSLEDLSNNGIDVMDVHISGGLGSLDNRAITHAIRLNDRHIPGSPAKDGSTFIPHATNETEDYLLVRTSSMGYASQPWAPATVTIFRKGPTVAGSLDLVFCNEWKSIDVLGEGWADNSVLRVGVTERMTVLGSSSTQALEWVLLDECVNIDLKGTFGKDFGFRFSDLSPDRETIFSIEGFGYPVERNIRSGSSVKHRHIGGFRGPWIKESRVSGVHVDWENSRFYLGTLDGRILIGDLRH